MTIEERIVCQEVGQFLSKKYPLFYNDNGKCLYIVGAEGDSHYKESDLYEGTLNALENMGIELLPVSSECLHECCAYRRIRY